MTHAIHEGNMERLLKKVTRIQNKCRKYGCDFRFEEVGEEFREVKTENDETIVSRFVLVEAEGKAIVNGWRFIASVEHTEKGNLISGVCDIEVPERYYNSNPVCEHCNSRRRRNSTFIVQNMETGEFKQVGKSCLRDFTHGMSVEGVAAYTALFDDIIKGEEPVLGGHFERFLPTREFLLYVAECIRHFGYIKRNCEGLRATVERASDYYCVDMGYIRFRPLVEQYQREMDAVGFTPNSEKNAEYVDAALAWVNEQEETSNYMHNLKTACALSYVRFRNSGILASLFPAYDRELERQAKLAEEKAKREREAQKSEWVGNINDRVTVKVDDYRAVTSWGTDWGTTYIYKIVDTTGNVFTWKTSKVLDDDLTILIGTVKAHNEFRGTKQTELTRCKAKYAA